MSKHIFKIQKMEYSKNRKQAESYIDLINSESNLKKYSDLIENISQETLDERLEQSQIVLERIAKCEKLIFKKINESDLLYCLHCKIFIDSARKNICSQCYHIFCEKHKLEIRHNCPNMAKDEKTELYQNAKNIFQKRLKQIRMKVGS